MGDIQMKPKTKTGRPKTGVVPNEIPIRGTPGIRLEDMRRGDRITYVDPKAGSRHITQISKIDSKGNIHTANPWVGSKMILKLSNVREIWKSENEDWVKQPLYQ